MVNMILAFLITFVLFFFGIKGFVKLAKKEKLALTKVIVYAIICAMLATAALVGIVIIF